MRPRLFPTATYSLPVEKSMLVTCPSGVPCVGQFEYAVREGRWIYVPKRERVSRGEVWLMTGVPSASDPFWRR